MPLPDPTDVAPVPGRVLTWGLLGPGKGLEWGIAAMAQLTDLVPTPHYLIAGEIHPKVLARDGDVYRQQLRRQAEDLGVGHMVSFDSSYRPTEELTRLIATAQVVLLPYDSTEQVTSGVLIEAVAVGRPVVATRFPHAVELLTDGVGITVPHKDPTAMAAALRQVLTDPETERRAGRRRSGWARPCSGRPSRVATCSSPANCWHRPARGRRRCRLLSRGVMTGAAAALPEPVFDHLRRLTDSIGLHEHALGDVPRPEHGYCVDDAARALVLTCRAADPALDELTRRYLDVVLAAIAPDGRCHNRLGTAGEWQDAPGLGDWWGRAVWALGVAAACGPAWAREPALAGFNQPGPAALALGAVDGVRLPRCSGTDRHRSAGTLAARRSRLRRPQCRGRQRPASRPTGPGRRHGCATTMPGCPRRSLRPGPPWTAPSWCRTGLDQLRFLLAVETTAGHLSVTPVGGRGPGERGPAFDQQPIEVAGIADACGRAWRLTGDPGWLAGLRLAWAWFEGGNDADIAMYDPDTGAGYDGLQAEGRNFNRGAESTIAALSTLIQARTAGADECPHPSRTIQTSTSSPISSG